MAGLVLVDALLLLSFAVAVACVCGADFFFLFLLTPLSCVCVSDRFGSHKRNDRTSSFVRSNWTRFLWFSTTNIQRDTTWANQQMDGWMGENVVSGWSVLVNLPLSLSLSLSLSVS